MVFASRSRSWRDLASAASALASTTSAFLYWNLRPSATAAAASVSCSARLVARSIAATLPPVSDAHESARPSVADRAEVEAVVADPQAGPDPGRVVRADPRDGPPAAPGASSVASAMRASCASPAAIVFWRPAVSRSTSFVRASRPISPNASTSSEQRAEVAGRGSQLGRERPGRWSRSAPAAHRRPAAGWRR